MCAPGERYGEYTTPFAAGAPHPSWKCSAANAQDAGACPRAPEVAQSPIESVEKALRSSSNLTAQLLHFLARHKDLDGPSVSPDESGSVTSRHRALIQHCLETLAAQIALLGHLSAGLLGDSRLLRGSPGRPSGRQPARDGAANMDARQTLRPDQATGPGTGRVWQ
ncbi:unnamed protein product [Polarella glacialis]|uniref:Uncharacterized protein n=1 Tax=Polarella glacialis TaxID=89957 RepID=A0A813DFD9_POLGL|nr:unnamed protein product [Polarella glacialis]